jgi:predicted ribosomally synthesized peptide with SipW-like signal peptide
MRNILLSSVAVVALLVAGIGGTFATWSDSETSTNNTIVTGSLDLKVNGADDQPWGEGVPKVIDLECVVPDRWYFGGEFSLWNAGQCTEAARAYFHLKEYLCTNVDPKEYLNEAGQWVSSGYYDTEMTSQDYGPRAPWPPESFYKPEPELIAEWGGPGASLGKVDCRWVPGIGGPEGDECSMGSNLFMQVTLAPFNPDHPYYDTHPEDVIGPSIPEALEKWWCKEIYLFDLPPCTEKSVYVWFFLYQKSEDELIGMADFFPTPTDEVSAFEHKLFNDWPSWALMKDKATLKIEFDLTLADI